MASGKPLHLRPPRLRHHLPVSRRSSRLMLRCAARFSPRPNNSSLRGAMVEEARRQAARKLAMREMTDAREAKDVVHAMEQLSAEKRNARPMLRRRWRTISSGSCTP